MTAPFRILIPDAQFDGEPAVEQAVAGDAAAFMVHRASRPAEIPGADWAAADAVLLWHVIDLDQAVAETLERCRVVVRVGIGVDRVDLAACGRRGIPVCNVPSYDMTDVATTAVTMALDLMRGVTSYTTALRADLAGNWRWRGPPAIRRVRGRRFGVVGCGRIGTAALMRARGFGIAVGYHDPYLAVGHDLALGVARFATLADLLAWADVVSLHTPLNDETRHLIDAAAVAGMKPGLILINCARGGLVDLDALAAGIRDGRIAAAGLDAFEREPPPPHPLLDAWQRAEPWIDGRLVLTPHGSWYSPETFDDLRRDAATTALDYLARGDLRNCVNGPHLTGPRI